MKAGGAAQAHVAARPPAEDRGAPLLLLQLGALKLGDPELLRALKSILRLIGTQYHSEASLVLSNCDHLLQHALIHWVSHLVTLCHIRSPTPRLILLLFLNAPHPISQSIRLAAFMVPRRTASLPPEGREEGGGYVVRPFLLRRRLRCRRAEDDSSLSAYFILGMMSR